MNLRTAGSSTARSADTFDRRRRSLAPLVIVTVAALVFAILLVLVRLQFFLPVARGRWRPAFITVIVALIALIGISRILLGVHYLSDVVGARAVGITWLGVTTFAFELARSAAGRPVTEPVSEGLEPEARVDLKRPSPNPPPVPPSAATAAPPPRSWWPGC